MGASVVDGCQTQGNRQPPLPPLPPFLASLPTAHTLLTQQALTFYTHTRNSATRPQVSSSPRRHHGKSPSPSPFPPHLSHFIIIDRRPFLIPTLHPSVPPSLSHSLSSRSSRTSSTLSGTRPSSVVAVVRGMEEEKRREGMRKGGRAGRDRWRKRITWREENTHQRVVQLRRGGKIH